MYVPLPLPLPSFARARADDGACGVGMKKGGDSGFEKTYKQCLRYSEGLLKELVGEEVGEKL